MCIRDSHHKSPGHFTIGEGTVRVYCNLTRALACPPAAGSERYARSLVDVVPRETATVLRTPPLPERS
eukprot:9203458-Alexandrium_andersonii.AAC.1